MRCAALGEAWLRFGAGPVSAYGDFDLEFVRVHLARLGIPALPARMMPATQGVLLVDSYDTALRRAMADSASACLRALVDDLGCDVPTGYGAVWNPNASGNAAMYPSFSGVVIAGDGAIAIRSGLPKWEPRQNKKVVVSVGGGRLPGSWRDAFVILGSIRTDCQFSNAGSWRLAGWRAIEPSKLWNQAARAQVLVTAAGSTVWEAAHVRIPVVLLEIAANQRDIFAWGTAAGVPGVNLSRVVDPMKVALQLSAALDHARPLPKVEDGSRNIVAALLAAMGR